MILLDSNEKNLYELINNLSSFKKNTHFILGNCCDEKFMKTLLQKNNIELIFHTSAYKHVNLVEENPIQGLYNNVISSLIICKLSSFLKIPKVILISSDKAVRPKNIMGASKEYLRFYFRLLTMNFKIPVFYS